MLRLILGWTLRGVTIGAAAALLLLIGIAAIFGARLRGDLNGLHALDPISFLLGLSVLVVVIGIAIYLPARRALGMTPLAALHRD